MHLSRDKWNEKEDEELRGVASNLDNLMPGNRCAIELYSDTRTLRKGQQLSNAMVEMPRIGKAELSGHSD